VRKEAFYFQHDYNARNDEKILELRAKFGAEGYGIYWMLVESMSENKDCKLDISNIGGLSLGYGVAIKLIKEVISFSESVGLLKTSENLFWSPRLMEHKKFRNMLSKAGRAGASKRWGAIRGATSTPNAKDSIVKESKVKDNKKKVCETSSLLKATFLKYVDEDYYWVAKDGAACKHIYTRLKAMLKNKNLVEPSTEEINDSFQVIMNKLPDWYKGKEIAVINSKLNDIIYEIKNPKNGKHRKLDAKKLFGDLQPGQGK